jgi:hypothetical protein
MSLTAISTPITPALMAARAARLPTGPGTINIINSRITDNLAAVPVVDNENGGGGGIANLSTGTVNITNSYILQNHVTGGRKFSAVMGGGIYNASTGTVNVTNSWIGNNDVKMTAAADSYGGGGGIGNADAGPVNVTDSVISANFISGGDGTKAPGIRGAGILNATTGAITGHVRSLFRQHRQWGTRRRHLKRSGNSERH